MRGLRSSVIVLVTLFLFLISGNGISEARAQSQVELEREIYKEIITLPYYGIFDHIAFKIDGKKVFLYGKVMQPTTKESAGRVVEKIKGVEKVENYIDVLPLSRFDDTIRYRTWRSIANKGSLYRYFLGANSSIKIIVEDGRVWLEGYVDNEGDANLAYIAAREVPGTFGVENNLQVIREVK